VDVIIVSTNAWPTVQSEGWADESTRAILGETKIGMAIPIGAAMPTLDDVASFTAFIRRVRTIGLVDPNGGSGTAPLFMKAVEKLGLGPEIAPKYRFFPGAGEAVADAIAHGDVETGATSMTELAPNKDIQLIGPVPSDVLDWVGITYVAVGIKADNPTEARAFLKFLNSPTARQAFSAIGLNSAP
jgi:molybdate transport system substrate-binding protein